MSDLVLTRHAPRLVEAIALPVLDAASLHGRPVPAREFLVDPLIPARTVTLLAGDGGTGKSLLALQLAVAMVARLLWLRMQVTAGRVLVLSAEDETDEIHRRLFDIVRHLGITLGDLKGLRVVPLAGEDAVVAAPGMRSTVIEPTPLWQRLISQIEEFRPKAIIADTVADFFAGDENQRAQARQFISLWRGVALKHDTTPILLAHPSLTGLATGTGSSGSTAWANSVRSRLYLTRVLDGDKAEADRDLRVLRTTKANYSRIGAEIRLRWTSGVFVAEEGQAVTGLDRLAADQAAEHAFMACLKLTLGQGRYFSPNKSASFAPANFARLPEAKGSRPNALSQAMDRLLSAGRIVIRTDGPPSRPRQVIDLPAQEAE